MAKKPPFVPQSGPNYSPTLLDDHGSRSGPRNHPSLSSQQQHPISASNQSRPISHLPPFHPRHPRALSPFDPTPRPSTETQPSPHFSPSTTPQIRPIPLFPPPYSAPHHQTQFASSATSHPPNMDRYSIANLADRYLRGTDKYPHNQHSLLDQRRMSEPPMYGNAASGQPTNAANLSNARHHQLQHHYSYVPPQSYGPHSSPLRRPSIGGSSWKEDHHLPLQPHGSIEVEEPLSPLNPTFSGGESPPPMGMSEIMFGSLHEDYGPSPPGTGTSTSSNAPATQGYATGEPSSASNSKQYSFVSLPGNAVKKRPRRRYDEIERLYQCSWQNCTKSYGTLNHLNAHITMQKHGHKRSPNGELKSYSPSTIPLVEHTLTNDVIEFKELRKQWRKAKKEEADARAVDEARQGSHQTHHPSHYQTSPHSMSNAEYQTHDIYAHHASRSAHPVGPLDDPHDPLAHQQDIYHRRSTRYVPFVSPPQQHSGITYPHPHAHGANTSNIPMNRLPTNSTLLTPLPGYGSSSMSASGPDAYDPYRTDSRPRTSQGSPDRGRTRSSHINLNTGRNRDGPYQ